MRFFVGLHHPSDAKHFASAFISISALRRRKSPFQVQDWILDSGAFTTITRFGGYPEKPSEYAKEIARWSRNGKLLAAVSQDYMCEKHMLSITGKTIEEHQTLTVERYDSLLQEDVGGVHIMPVLQGYHPDDYVRHIDQYGYRMLEGMWVGVGSVCKRNGNPKAIEEVLSAIKRERPDLLIHGFGVKKTALRSESVCRLLHTSDSMAWSFAARREGRDQNDWREAEIYAKDIQRILGSHRIA